MNFVKITFFKMFITALKLPKILYERKSDITSGLKTQFCIFFYKLLLYHLFRRQRVSSDGSSTYSHLHISLSIYHKQHYNINLTVQTFSTSHILRILHMFCFLLMNKRIFQKQIHHTITMRPRL